MLKSSCNSQKIGFLLGVLLPVVSFLGFYFIRYGDIPLMEFIKYIYFRGVISPLISLNILPNLVAFFVFIRMDYLFSARGVLVATFLFAVVVLILKFLT